MKKYYLFAILLANLVSCQKKDNQEQTSASDWMIFTSANSTLVPQYCVNTLFFDKSGTLWVSCEYLQRYDGTTWTQFDNTNTGITTYFCVTDGLKTNSGINWFGSDIGLIKLQNNLWSMYTMYNSGLPSSGINGVAIDTQNNLWLATDQGIVKYDGGSNWTIYNEGNTQITCRYVKYIKSTSDGTIWAGIVLNKQVCPTALTGCLARYQNGNWTIFTSSNSNLPTGDIRTIELDKNENLWLVVDWKLVKYNGTGFDNYTPSDSIINSGNVMNGIAFDNQNNLWVATLQQGVFKFDGNTWKNFTTQNSKLPYDDAGCVVIDNNNNKWFATIDEVAEYTGN